jgi:hypothetical protein
MRKTLTLLSHPNNPSLGQFLKAIEVEGIIISPIRSDSQDDTGVAIMAAEVL